VAVGSHGILGSREMRRIATYTGGKYYEVKNANALPKIYQREARRIARPLVYEPGCRSASRCCGKSKASSARK
jgi:hypothetical protein